ncbi:ribulose-phosphate 3-epimerase [Lewinellaceae bacterium SD302]|nr:ribulose-phosphate 3-epimerase [Lewinellaceae bacterium SD302]
MSKHLIAPSLLAADFLDLQSSIALVNESKADWFHLDVMDGRFVPNISFGMFIIKQISTLAKKPLDVHLMIEEPERYISAFAAAGAQSITVHYEACPHLHRTIQQIKEAGCRAGVALNPHTPVSLVEDIIEDLDLLLLMSVNPGFGGQKFIYRTISRIEQARSMIITHNSRALIEVDGGVGLQNAQKILSAGADVLVAGSAVFKAEDPRWVIEQMKGISENPVGMV